MLIELDADVYERSDEEEDRDDEEPDEVPDEALSAMARYQYLLDASRDRYWHGLFSFTFFQKKLK